MVPVVYAHRTAGVDARAEAQEMDSRRAPSCFAVEGRFPDAFHFFLNILTYRFGLVLF